VAELFRDRRLLVLLALGFSAGVPLPLVAGQVLRQWFVESGMSLADLGLTALIGLAYANKFHWAPALDAVRPAPNGSAVAIGSAKLNRGMPQPETSSQEPPRGATWAAAARGVALESRLDINTAAVPDICGQLCGHVLQFDKVALQGHQADKHWRQSPSR
jgi:hypothetical protein